VADHVFAWFKELDRVRPVGLSPGPIDFLQIESWARLRGIELREWELDLLLCMDKARLKHHRDSVGTDAEEDKEKDVISERPLSPALFDALFPGEAP
jgi:hypothetical protein